MRSVDRGLRATLLVGLLSAAVAGLGGCALLAPSSEPAATSAAAASAPTQAVDAPKATAATAPTEQAKAATLAAAPAETAAAPVTPPPVPVDPAAQRAFDDALRLLRAGRADEAERAFRALAQAHPALGGVHANLALLHRRAGRDAEAVAELEEAVRLSPRQPIYFNQLGIAYRQAGQFAKAREAYETAIALDAGYAAPQLNLAILLDLYLGDRPRATEWYQRSAVLLPGDAAQINKWLVELRGRKPEAGVANAPMAAAVAVRKEKE
jgi:Flp pilus assembly protein TadD